MKPLMAIGSLLGFTCLTAISCSLGNQEGPDVTCEDLECGRINACKEGIIAQCVDGQTVRFHVCGTEDVCTAGWQTPGQFRCSSEATDCEGCRPEREGGCGAGTGGGGGTGGSGGGGGGGATGGSGGATSTNGSGGTGGSAGGGGGAGGAGGS